MVLASIAKSAPSAPAFRESRETKPDRVLGRINSENYHPPTLQKTWIREYMCNLIGFRGPLNAHLRALAQHGTSAKNIQEWDM